jgi:hypothetical protein
MKKIDLSQIINALPNIGVIVGIIFLVFELRQIQEQGEAQANYNFFNSVNTGITEATTSPYLAGVIAKVISNGDLTEAEAVSGQFWLISILLLWEYGWSEMEAGRYDLDQYNIGEKISTWNNLSALRELWVDQQPGLNPGFVAFMQENVIDQ